MTITDLNHDGIINCQDYVIRNAQIVEKLGVTPVFLVTPSKHPKHIFIMFTHGGNRYIMDNDKMYVIKDSVL